MTDTPFSYNDHVTVGTSSEAAEWVRNSSLRPECKEAHLRLISRFPTQSFTREDNALLDYREAIDSISVPAWMRAARTTLSGFGSAFAVRFDSIGQASPRADYVQDIWYTWELASWDEEIRGILRDGMRVYPLADLRESLNSYLAIDLTNPDDDQIYEFSYLSAVDNWSMDEPLRDVMFPAFSSYCDMISHIVAVQTTDGSVVDADEG